MAIARGKDKEALARQLGAEHYVDSEAQDPAQGGKARFRVVLTTGA